MPRITHPDAAAGCLPSASPIAFTCKPKRPAPSYPVGDVVNQAIEKTLPARGINQPPRKDRHNTCPLCPARLVHLTPRLQKAAFLDGNWPGVLREEGESELR